MAIILAVLLGLSLSAAAGFRVFVPFLVISIATKAGFVQLADEFLWIGSNQALAIFLIAMVLEIAAYYFPFIDNFLDIIAFPAAIVAGAVLSASVITDMSPVLKWTLAIIAGGGISATIHMTTTATRGMSAVATAGVGNNIVASLENILSTLISILALISPLFAVILILIIVFFIIKFHKKRKSKSSNE